MGLRLGLRVSQGGSPKRYGFVVGREPGGERRWLVRFDGGAEREPVAASALTPEVLDEVSGMASFDPGTLPADELHERRFLPEPPERVEQAFDFGRERFDFRRWFLEDIVRPAAALTLPSPLTALTLPAECRAPGPAGAAPEPEPEPEAEPAVGHGDRRDETARLLSNLHRTVAAGQRALEIGAIPAPEPSAVAATGVRKSASDLDITVLAIAW